ncbi:hypothetical protein DPMN_162240 [Dreissena polymorpha]|uniref:Uncharacterized protein n=1 Tax=Dreissena polymorpha TaxID=45954 RepID=A0A9D4ETN1_DREPO|nr:hypothetical protein DPMN_162240 [Dreissena polymorpha]
MMDTNPRKTASTNSGSELDTFVFKSTWIDLDLLKQLHVSAEPKNKRPSTYYRAAPTWKRPAKHIGQQKQPFKPNCGAVQTTYDKQCNSSLHHNCKYNGHKKMERINK